MLVWCWCPALIHRLDKLVREPTDGNAWHADHIIPVYKGGGMVKHAQVFVRLMLAQHDNIFWFFSGECKLENMRTLCVACHYEVTRAQHKELKEIRKKAKEHLKNALNQQNDKVSILSVSQSSLNFFFCKSKGAHVLWATSSLKSETAMFNLPSFDAPHVFVFLLH